ncbi:MAG: hypothetical protein D6812_10710, partial [Deltaproteobacteria bacterium]
MFHSCPKCRIRLERREAKDGLFWRCGCCAGHAVPIALVRKRTEREFSRELWRKAVEEALPTGDPCPACTFPMREVTMRLDEFPLSAQICKACGLVWLDASDYEKLPREEPRIVIDMETRLLHRHIEIVEQCLREDHPCPACGNRLVHARNADGLLWHCTTCEAFGVTLTFLKRATVGEFPARLWQESQQGTIENDTPCPFCKQPMNALLLPPTPHARRRLALTVCRPCHFVWMTEKSFCALPWRPVDPKRVPRGSTLSSPS